MVNESARKRHRDTWRKGISESKWAERKLKRIQRGSLQVCCAPSPSSCGTEGRSRSGFPSSRTWSLRIRSPELENESGLRKPTPGQSPPSKRDSGQEGKGLRPRGPPFCERSDQQPIHLALPWERNATVNKSHSHKPYQKRILIKTSLVELVEREYFAGPTKPWIFHYVLTGQSESHWQEPRAAMARRGGRRVPLHPGFEVSR